MQRGRLLILLGIVLGLLTVGLVAFFALGSGGLPGTEPEPTPPGPSASPTSIPTTQVIVALQPIARGAEFVQGSVGPRPWPAGNVPPEVIADEAELFGKVAKTEIVQGQPIVRTLLVDKGGAGEASLSIPRGRVAVAYPITRQRSVAFAIQPGDSVDVLITSFFIDVDEEFQAPLPNKIRFFFPTYDQTSGSQTGVQLSEVFDEGRFELGADEIASIVGASGPQVPRRVAQLTVESAKVLRIGNWPDSAGNPIVTGPVQQQPQEEGAPPPPPPPPDIVTLAVEPQDALVLLWLRQSGIYSELALRAAGDDDAEHITEAVTLQYMLTRFNIAVPPKIEFVMAPSIVELQEASQISEQVAPVPGE